MKSIKNKRVWKFAGLVAVDGAVFGSTNAGNAPSFMMVVGFVLLVVTFYYLIRGLLALARLYGLSVKRKYRLAGSLTALVGFLVALQSIGELNPIDIAVLLPLVIIGYVYSFYGAVARRGTQQTD